MNQIKLMTVALVVAGFVIVIQLGVIQYHRVRVRQVQSELAAAQAYQHGLEQLLRRSLRQNESLQEFIQQVATTTEDLVSSTQSLQVITQEVMEQHIDTLRDTLWVNGGY